MQNSSNVAIEQKQSQSQTRAETAGKTKTAPGPKPPDCGQVPVAMPTETPKAETPAVAGKGESQAGTQNPTATVAQPPKMPMAQVYAPHIAVASILLSIVLGLIIFKMRAEQKRLCKRCPHCGGKLERWADECNHCGKNIFVYPTA